MKKIILIILFLTACSEGGNDRSTTVTLQVGNPVIVHYEFLESSVDVQKAYRKIIVGASKDSIKFEKLPKSRDRKIASRDGFHYYKNGECYLVIVRPKKLSFRDFESVVGHEMLHCWFGKFHPSNGDLPRRLMISRRFK